MAYVEGRSLADRIGSGPPLPQRQAAALVRQLALALEVAHRHGVIHRDLKPGNVLMNADGEPILTDFGLARRLHQADERLTPSGAILGTPAYMSPEQVEARSEAIGPAADVYGLGVILYELLTGRTPFRGSMASVLAQIVSAEPERPSLLRSDLSPHLEGIVMKAMAKKVEDRYPSMADLATGLADYLDADAAQARPVNRVAPLLGGTAQTAGTATVSPGGPTAARPQAPPRGRRPVLTAVGVLAALVLLAGVLIIRIKGSNGKEETIRVPDDGTVTITDGTGKQLAKVGPVATPGNGDKDPRANGPLATEKHKTGLLVDVKRIQRTSDGYLTIRWRYRNPTDEPIELFGWYGLGLAPENSGKLMLDALYFVDSSDTKAPRKHMIVRDNNGVRLAYEFTSSTTTVKGKSELEMWAKFPAPPASCTSITLYMRDVSPFEDLPVPPPEKK
jgi:hypothetical protein